MALSVDALISAAMPPRPRVTCEPALPAEAPLSMPTQSLSRWSAEEKAAFRARARGTTPWLARLFVFGGALLLTAYGAYEMYAVVSVSRTTGLQYLLLALFVINFSWIALAFTSGLLGFLAVLFRRRRMQGNPDAPLTTRTAIVMPVYNEQTSRTFAAVQAIRESVDATGAGAAFDYFILSDSTNPDAWIAEERAFLALRADLGPDHRTYYRHREKNHHRKAGNIADFVTRWGGSYEQMLVLDADSLMTGDCIVTLAKAMEADPKAGIIQSLPILLNRNTLFARLQQFAAQVAGPVIATGLAIWSGRDGNYWGHNAVIRTRAFAAHCGLPDLKGSPPFGGHVLSHDFVEAALIRRAGWSVTMLPLLEGSYEESPPSLIDLSVRDRRWCQGNLQHSRVIGTRGLRLATRQHFATGIMGYVASPFWLAQLLVGIALVLQTTYIRPEYFTRDFRLFPSWPRFDPERALWLFGITMAILIAPKIFGLILMLFDGRRRRACGGAIRLVISALIEIILSGLIAPILMLVQSGSVFQILLGRDTGWNPQRRDDGSIPLRDIVRRHRWHTFMGVDLHLALSMDVAHDPGPRARDPALLAVGVADGRARAEAPRPVADPERGGAARHRRAFERPAGGKRAARLRRRRFPCRAAHGPGLPRPARGHAAAPPSSPSRRVRARPCDGRGEDHRRGIGERRRALAEAQGAHGRAERPRPARAADAARPG
jgi:membrane glycosyltransferase